MKKLFLFIAFAVVCLTAGAQMYVGGKAGFWREWQKGANTTDLSIHPDIGYNLNEKWSVGLYFGYDYTYKDGNKYNGFDIEPYARYTYAKFGPVGLFVEGAFGYYTYKKKTNGVTGDAQNAWYVGLTPGLKVDLTERLTFFSYIGFLGYTDADEDAVFGRNGFDFNVDGNNLQFGILYNF